MMFSSCTPSTNYDTITNVDKGKISGGRLGPAGVLNYITSEQVPLHIPKTVDITHSHGSASVVRATTQVNGEMGNSTHCHSQNP